MLSALFAVTALLLFLAGASVFSFLEVVAWRLPRGMDFVRGRSVCPACGRALSPAELVPVFSYLFLRGRCRSCGARIPVSCLLSELLGGALALWCCWYFRTELPHAAAAFAFLAVLYLVAVVDARTQEIPDGFVLALAVTALASAFVFREIGWLSRLIGVFCVSVPLFLIALAIPGAFGGGDIKLMAACGAFLGWRLNLFALAAAVLAGGVYGAFLLLTRRAQKGSHFAFGPFLCAGAALALFAGERCIAWYLGFFH